jgi:MbtH protein
LRYPKYSLERSLIWTAVVSAAMTQHQKDAVMNEDDFAYLVLVNHEEQYSLWPTFKEIPNGWRQVGPIGSKQDCLAYVESVWKDMRPLGVRQRLFESA